MQLRRGLQNFRDTHGFNMKFRGQPMVAPADDRDLPVDRRCRGVTGDLPLAVHCRGGAAWCYQRVPRISPPTPRTVQLQG